MHRPGADAERLGRFEDSRAGRQLRTDALDNALAHRATPEALSLSSSTREAQVDRPANDRTLVSAKPSDRR